MAIEASAVRCSFGDSIIMERVERELDEHLSKGRVRSVGKLVTVNDKEGYEYVRSVVGVLSKEEAQELERRYAKAGWDEVSIVPDPSKATTTARFFLNK
jgi:hypothetical protein